jgi:uncharacterized protein DUF4236
MKLFPGVRLNFGKRSVGISAGVPGRRLWSKWPLWLRTDVACTDPEWPLTSPDAVVWIQRRPLRHLRNEGQKAIARPAPIDFVEGVK